jgi:hypothetical protein
MAFRVEESVVIDRPREEVWDYVIEHDEWRRPDVLEVGKVTDTFPRFLRQLKGILESKQSE